MEAPCSRCGCQRPFHDRWEEQSKRNYEYRESYKRAASAHAIEVAEKDLRILDLQESQKWLQQKVKKQAAHLRRLEEKLTRLGQQPYALETGGVVSIQKFDPSQVTINNDRH